MAPAMPIRSGRRRDPCATRDAAVGGRRHAGAAARACRSTTRSSTPIWEAMDEADLAILHHSFFYEPPYFPGYSDIWGNVVVARAAAHPWGAQRLLGYFLLSGLFDRTRTCASASPSAAPAGCRRG